MALTPTITPDSTPMIAITPNVVVSSYADVASATGISYSQLLQSLGTNVYGSNFFYVASTSYTQIGQAYKYLHFDSNGNQIDTYLPFSVDPYQNQPALYFETNPDEVVFDGFASLTFNIEPQTSVFFKMFADVVSNSQQLDVLGESNFEKVEKIEGVKFFDDYCNYLIDDK